jgi:holo-[acyl-carrier protein] synthase
MTWNDVEVKNDESGRPEINLKQRAREIADDMGVEKIHISLTHTDECAAAVVILEK